MRYTTATQRINAVAAVCHQAKAEGWKYGDSHTFPPCADGYISCDRLIARALWNLGFKDQPKVGSTCGITTFNMDEWMREHGATVITDQTKTKKGDFVLMKKRGTVTPNEEWHAFVMASDYGPSINKYDLGSQTRINLGGYFAGAAFNEWSTKEFFAAYRMPSGSKKTEKYTKILPAVYLGKKGSAVRLLQKLLLYANCKGADGQALKVDGVCGANTVHAINVYQDRKRRRGVELGTNGKSDGICAEKMWRSMIG